MNLLPPLPEWMPYWVPIAVLVPVLLWGLAFLFVPFSVIGIKGRLEAMEARLEALHQELRAISARLPEATPQRPPRRAYDTGYTPPPPPQPVAIPDPPPPIPPASSDWQEPQPQATKPVRTGRRVEDARLRGEEPRLDWPHR